MVEVLALVIPLVGRAVEVEVLTSPEVEVVAAIVVSLTSQNVS